MPSDGLSWHEREARGRERVHKMLQDFEAALPLNEGAKAIVELVDDHNRMVRQLFMRTSDERAAQRTIEAMRKVRLALNELGKVREV